MSDCEPLIPLRTTEEQLGGVTGKGFLPGTSGNAGGRPAMSRHVRDLARESTPEAIATLVQVMREGKTDAARVAAALALLDRAWGRPAISIGSEEEAADRAVIILESSVPRPVRPTERPAPLSQVVAARQEASRRQEAGFSRGQEASSMTPPLASAHESAVPI